MNRCTYCANYKISALYYPEIWNLPLSTICIKLNYPKMYDEDELKEDPTWGHKKDCSDYERDPGLNESLSKECDEWEKLNGCDLQKSDQGWLDEKAGLRKQERVCLPLERWQALLPVI